MVISAAASIRMSRHPPGIILTYIFGQEQMSFFECRMLPVKKSGPEGSNPRWRPQNYENCYIHYNCYISEVEKWLDVLDGANISIWLLLLYASRQT